VKQILCYGDSNTYGYNINANAGQPIRLQSDLRWTGLLRLLLGDSYNIVVEGLSGRTIGFQDPFASGRRALDWWIPCIESHFPVDAIVLMLGTNDVKVEYHATPSQIASGLGQMIRELYQHYKLLQLDPPKLIVVCPPPLEETAGINSEGMFDLQSVAASHELAELYRQTAQTYSCCFLDAGKVTRFDMQEGIHLNINGHLLLAKAIAGIISGMNWLERLE